MPRQTVLHVSGRTAQGANNRAKTVCPFRFAEGMILAAFKVSQSQDSPTGVIVANLERAGEVQTGTARD
jgi:hypothetical protein